MYESLTNFISLLDAIDYGEWIIDKQNDGTKEHPIQMPWVRYDETVIQLIKAVYAYIQDHEELGLNQYAEILKKNRIEWEASSMMNADVSKLDGTTIVALILGVIRADRFCEGLLLDFCKRGYIVKWLIRLKEIDDNT